VAVAVAGFSRGAAGIAPQGEAVATFFRAVREAELVKQWEIEADLVGGQQRAVGAMVAGIAI
jgi:hypothetical protein